MLWKRSVKSANHCSNSPYVCRWGSRVATRIQGGVLLPARVRCPVFPGQGVPGRSSFLGGMKCHKALYNQKRKDSYDSFVNRIQDPQPGRSRRASTTTLPPASPATLRHPAGFVIAGRAPVGVLGPCRCHDGRVLLELSRSLVSDHAVGSIRPGKHGRRLRH